MKKRKKARRHLRHDGTTLWDTRPAGSTPLFDMPDWIEAPPEVLRLTGGPRKRRILRRFQHPCPVSGKSVKTYEVEGGLFCFESPGHGWLWTNRLTLTEPKKL